MNREEQKRRLAIAVDRGGMTDTQIAAEIGVSAMTVWRWRHGRTQIKDGMLRLIEMICRANEEMGIQP